MSNIFIKDIIGVSGSIYDVPEDDFEIADATSGLVKLFDTVPDLVYDRVLAWVETNTEIEGYRVLSCMVEKFFYKEKECPDTTEIQEMTSLIKDALESDFDINSIGEQVVNIFQAGAYFSWQRHLKEKYVCPTSVEDSIVVGGKEKRGRWFNNGDLVLGANKRIDGERLRVVGGGIRIEANGNKRGDISFTVRDKDPISPGEGDMWYNSNQHCFKYYDGAEVQILGGTW